MLKDKKNRAILILSLLLVIAILIICLKGCPGEKDIVKPQYWEKPGFKTDTLKVPYPVKGDSFPFQVPPKIVIQYLDSPNNGTIVSKEDSLLKVIDSLGLLVTLINEEYLTQYPDAPKLVGGLFTKDTLKLDLLHVSGKILSDLYIVDYGHFKYQLNKNGLRTLPLKEPEKPKETLSHGLYAKGGYEILSKKPYAGLDYYISYGKLNINLNPSLTVEATPSLQVCLGLGYKLK